MHLKNDIDYVYSEDSDIIAFGCLNIVKGLKSNETV